MIEILSQWQFSWVCILAGAVGGLVNAIATADCFVLPSVSGRKIFFASLKSVLIGAFIGFVVDTHPVFSALLGYSGMDVLQMLENKLRRRLLASTKDGDDNA
jgi:nitrate/nitrite transporter NarK